MARRRYQMPSVLLRRGKMAYWYIKYRIDVLGEDKALTRACKSKFLGYATGPDSIDKREAKRRRDAFMATINRADYVIQSQIPFKDFLKIYRRQHLPTLAASTQGKYGYHLDNHIEPAFADLRMCDVDTERIDAWLREKEADGLSHATRMDLRNIVSSIFTCAEKWGYWRDRNPAEHASVGRRGPVREKRKLPEDKLLELFDRLPVMVRLIIQVALFCTLRVSEILGLQEKHLDFASGLIMVRQRWYRGDLDVPKNSRAREVPMGHLEGVLARLCTGQPDRFVFAVPTRWGECRDDRDINQHFLRPAAKALGIYYKGFGFHAFRREAITALAGDLGPLQVMGLAGHAKADMSLLYTLEDREARHKAVKAFQERVGVVQ